MGEKIGGTPAWQNVQFHAATLNETFNEKRGVCLCTKKMRGAGAPRPNSSLKG
jgi:hypothetical protein